VRLPPSIRDSTQQETIVKTRNANKAYRPRQGLVALALSLLPVMAMHRAAAPSDGLDCSERGLIPGREGRA
jgi:hypothetical protein